MFNRFPFYIGLPRAPVPTWLEQRHHTQGCEISIPGTITFGSIVIVWTFKSQYYCRRLFDVGSVFLIKNATNITIEGQHPGAEKKPVIIDCSFLVPNTYILLLIAAILMIAWPSP